MAGGLLEVRLARPEDFLKVKETLTRMGRADDRVLTQICHILHKRGRYFIVHYKEMLRLDGLTVEVSADDLSRRNAIAFLLDGWDLCKVVDKPALEFRVPVGEIKVIPYRERSSWELVSHYTVGKKREKKT